jgi:hypothetical protein
MHHHFKAFRTFHSLLVDYFALRNFKEANFGVKFGLVLFLRVKGSVYDQVLVGRPHPIGDTLNRDGLLLSLRVNEQLHAWKRVNTDTLLDLGLSVNLSLGVELLGKVGAIEGPLVSFVVLLAISLKISNNFNHLEVPNSEASIPHRTIS